MGVGDLGTPTNTLNYHQTNATGATDTDGARIVAVYPDPVTEGDRGECVVLEIPQTDGRNWSLSDGETSIEVPETEARGRVAISDDSGVVCNRTDARSIIVEEMLRLSNAGETLRLRNDSGVADTVQYENARSASWYRNGSWHPLGATDFDPITVPGGTGRVFVLPDSPAVPVAPIRNASDRVSLAGYTFTSERVARALRSAAERGVRVRVLLDGAPVGGLSRREARILDRLVAAGVEVRMLGGPRARYAFHHAKYAVVDAKGLVLTENWKPEGVGGQSSRGWGIVLGAPTAERLERVFRADATAPDAIPWQRFRSHRNFSRETGGGPTRNGGPIQDGSSPSFATQFPARRVSVETVDVIVTPDNGGREIQHLLRSANESIRVVQMKIDGRNDSFLGATIAAARRGVRVEILLSSAWYVREDNRNLARWLRRTAEREDLPIAVRLADSRSRFEKVHAKGVLIDGEVVMVGSLNWNEESRRRNREVVAVVHGREAAAYFERVFESDWQGGAWRTPIGFVIAVAIVSLLAIRCLWRWVRFDQSP